MRDACPGLPDAPPQPRSLVRRANQLRPRAIPVPPSTSRACRWADVHKGAAAHAPGPGPPPFLRPGNGAWARETLRRRGAEGGAHDGERLQSPAVARCSGAPPLPRRAGPSANRGPRPIPVTSLARQPYCGPACFLSHAYAAPPPPPPPPCASAGALPADLLGPLERPGPSRSIAVTADRRRGPARATARPLSGDDWPPAGGAPGPLGAPAAPLPVRPRASERARTQRPRGL